MSKKENNIDENIAITKKAATRIKAILDAEKKIGHGLRLSVVGGGCSGMNYNIAFDNNKGEFDATTSSKYCFPCTLIELVLKLILIKIWMIYENRKRRILSVQNFIGGSIACSRFPQHIFNIT